MIAIHTFARKEFRDGLRNKWVAGATVILAALAFALTFVGSAPTGMLDVSPLAVSVVSISSLTIFLIPLIAFLLGYDAIVGEAERGCLLLTLTYPVINRARQILWVVTGAEKATMLQRLRAADPSIPGGRVRQADAVLFADRAAAPDR